eukprot:4449466-Prymnesium_polylepis.1
MLRLALLLLASGAHAASTQRPYVGAALNAPVELDRYVSIERGRANAVAAALVDSDHSEGKAADDRTRTLRSAPEPTAEDGTLSALAPHLHPSPAPMAENRTLAAFG